MNSETPEKPALAIAQRHHVPSWEVRALPAGGANHVYLLGDALVLRIPRSSAFVADLRKEAAVIPAARAVGVRTPAVVDFDDSTTLADVPYIVLECVPGVDLAELRLPAPERRAVHRQLGRELAKLHRIAAEEQVTIPHVPVEDEDGDPRELVERLLSDGMIDAGAQEWLAGWFDRLSARVPSRSPHVLLHGDVAPQNIVVSPGSAELGGLVDWGDAMWADPAAEFAKTPLSDIPATLEGYREENGEDQPSDSVWEARILRHHLVWALGRLAHPSPKPGERHWTAPPASRLLDLLRFYASAPDLPWSALT
ncbi:phosphotransferase family protein [Streptomyces radiopugnans]|uniref:phosphotransferase family protein n=1 Tax=Streptomyces radiopugnans TaxID=403935 RepID=UPI003F1C3C97